MADARLEPHGTFPDQLFHTLTLLSGRPFEGHAAGGNGWSAVVWDLVSSGMQKAFNRRRSGYENEPRYGGDSPAALDGFCQCHGAWDIPHSEIQEVLGSDRPLSVFLQNSDRPPVESEHTADDTPIRAVSMLIMETAGKDEYRRE